MRRSLHAQRLVVCAGDVTPGVGFGERETALFRVCFLLISFSDEEEEELHTYIVSTRERSLQCATALHHYSAYGFSRDACQVHEINAAHTRARASYTKRSRLQGALLCTG